jgi:hypothetical protein
MRLKSALTHASAAFASRFFGVTAVFRITGISTITTDQANVMAALGIKKPRQPEQSASCSGKFQSRSI